MWVRRVYVSRRVLPSGYSLVKDIQRYGETSPPPSEVKSKPSKIPTWSIYIYIYIYIYGGKRDRVYRQKNNFVRYTVLRV
jgi:hypothetical protein